MKGALDTNMDAFRSDLTLESAEQIGITGKNARRLPGVRVSERFSEDYAVTAITIADREGSRALETELANG